MFDGGIGPPKSTRDVCHYKAITKLLHLASFHNVCRTNNKINWSTLEKQPLHVPWCPISVKLENLSFEIIKVQQRDYDFT